MSDDSQATPEFVAWCLTWPCEFRSRFDLADPLHTERSLKSLRAASVALAENRCVQGWCVSRSSTKLTCETPQGFRLDDIVKRLGGSEKVSQTCQACPANTLSSQQFWAGCFGFFPLDENLLQLPSNLDLLRDTSEALEIYQTVSMALPPSNANPRSVWAEIWKSPLISGSQSNSVLKLLEQAIPEVGRALPDWQSLRQALLISGRMESGISLAVRHLPTGLVTGRQWIWSSRCVYCQAPRENRSRCTRCGDRSAPLNPEKRGARGTRPYRNLRELLDESELSRLVAELAFNDRQIASKPD